jgi:hypothetical protein
VIQPPLPPLLCLFLCLFSMEVFGSGVFPKQLSI